MPVNSFENYPMSWKPVLKKGTEPLYKMLAAQLEADIADGILLPGTKLPPQRELADFLDINVSTVSRAFAICSRKGLLSGSVGSGTYVAYDVCTNIFSTPTIPKPHVIELGSLIPETISQHEIISLFHKMIQEQDIGMLFQYRHDIADWQKEAAAKLMERVGCPVSTSDIMTASGGQNAISAIFAGLFEPGDKVGVDPLIYPGLKSAAKLFGIQLIPIMQENGEMSEEGLRYAVKNDGIRAVYVMPDYHNPTTHTLSEHGRSVIAKSAKEFNLLIIEDGINSLLLPDNKKTIYANAPEHVIFMLSLSKTVSPALRLAYLAVPKRFQRKMENSLYNINLSQSALLMELTSRLIVSGQLDNLLERRRLGLKKRNQITEQILAGCNVLGDENSLSRWLLLPEGNSGSEFENMALQRGVFVYGSERFAVGKNAPVGAARLAICAPDNLDELKQGLMILKDLLDSLKS